MTSYALSGEEAVAALDLVQWRLTRYHVTIRFDDPGAGHRCCCNNRAYHGTRIGIREVQIEVPVPADPP